jgi:hypothetical protein
VVKRLFWAYPHTSWVVTLDADYRIVEQAIALRFDPQSRIPWVKGPFLGERADQFADSTTGANVKLRDYSLPHS